MQFLDDFQEYLASTFAITKIDVETNAEASEDEIKEWEEKNQVKAPKDLKNFYLSSNGLHVKWNGKYGGHNIYNKPSLTPYQISVIEYLQQTLLFLKVFGGVSICALNTLVKFQPCCEPTALDNPLTCFTNDFKHFHKSNDFFILSRCTNHSYVLLSPSLGIYLLNRSMELGYICEGFMEYIRLAMLHYMLDGWECFLLGNVDAIPYEHNDPSPEPRYLSRWLSESRLSV
ncbi:Tubulin polyglutamylase complex subunit 2 [Echinococcus granulosus]|uniref:Tubulin polyglutamylase complex subunit 2 n=1 Tax=Echinococcus granulosus TaxID=6210 RepID=W6UZV2_ECHGR|nr:Tubulin polyglutamylase complex subunit 2 [Echinococcus granulosus]EUB59194.1 Tubulin polyglutamylase complex subunit 2 [Echinococcus granulosus]